MQLTPQELIATFDWSGLPHEIATEIYRLSGLFGDEEARSDASDYLHSTVLGADEFHRASIPISCPIVSSHQPGRHENPHHHDKETPENNTADKPVPRLNDRL